MRQYERESRWTPRHALTVVLIVGALAVGLLLVYRLTDGSAGDSDPRGVAADPTLPGTTPGPTDTAGPSAGFTPAPATRPSTTQAPAAASSDGVVRTPPPATSDVPSFSPHEADLPTSIRADAGVDCVPRRTSLPARTVAAVECRPKTGPAELVGVYLFNSEEDAVVTYLDRMTDAGVTLRNEKCASGEPGDSSFHPGDGEIEGFEYQGELFNGARAGCFHNELRFANVRVVCGGLYIGVLGHGRDLTALYGWSVSRPPDEPVDTPGSPGICYGTRP